MSIDIPTELLTASSGSVGDVVFSRNQHGPYTRDRTPPFDPASALQLAVRAALSECVTAWNATLTQAERKAWDVFAHAVRTRARLGRSTHAGGLGMYIRANVPRIQAAVGATPRVDQAPTILSSPPLTPITRVVLNYLDDTIHPFFDVNDAWANEFRSPVLFYASPPQPRTVNFYRGPYRFAGRIDGGPLGPGQNPATIPLPFPAGSTDRVFVRGRLTLSDARLGPSFFLPADPVPAVAPLPIEALFLGAPPPVVTVEFDSTLRIETHDPANWSVRLNNFRRLVTQAFSLPPDRTRIQLVLRDQTLELGPDIVDFSPPPFDVHGLLTGLPVAAFADFPLT